MVAGRRQRASCARAWGGIDGRGARAADCVAGCGMRAFSRCGCVHHYAHALAILSHPRHGDDDRQRSHCCRRALAAPPISTGVTDGRDVGLLCVVAGRAVGCHALGWWRESARDARQNQRHLAAVLDLGPCSIKLGIRPKLLARMFGVSSITVTRSDDVEAFPVRRRLGTRGVGVRRNQEAPVYFWTTQPEAVLQALASADWPVSWDERRFAY